MSLSQALIQDEMRNITLDAPTPARYIFLHLGLATPNAGQHSQYLSALAILITFLMFGYSYPRGSGNKSVTAPYLGVSFTHLARFQFAFSAKRLVTEGYRQSKDSLFKLSGNDMLIVPAKYADELRNMPDTDLDAIKANTDNFQGVYSATSILNEGNLHNFVLQTKLTPRLSSLVPIVCNELDHAMEVEFRCGKDEFEPATAFKLLINIISRLSSRLFVGEELCRSEDWLATSRGYTENAFKTICFLRMFPDIIKPVVSIFVPWSWKVQYHLYNARRLLFPLIRKRREAKALGELDGSLKFTNLLQLMDDEAKAEDKDPDKLSRRVLILTLASSHTTSMAACQALFELCLRPQYVPCLREEIQAVLSEDGGWRKTTLTKLKKLDSFMKESQRFHPPSLLGMKRNVLRPLQLSDGTSIPTGSHILMPIVPHQRDDPRLDNPQEFDGLRYYKMRQNPEYANKLQFATTDGWNLHFGHGKHGCPGRFLASNTIKIILSRLILEYDFRFAPGEGRPKDWHVHEYIFPNPYGVVQFKKRT